MKYLLKILFFICFLVGVLCAILLFHFWDSRQQKEFSAVFLDNDQVYFGKIVYNSSTRLELTNVYYLRASVLKEAGDNAELALLKRGDELHAPKDRMVLNWDHILYYEPLKNDGVIMKAISKYAK